MRRKNYLFLLIPWILFFGSILTYAEEEVLTITTYYPSPYGSYNELEVKGKLALGDPASDPKIGTIDHLNEGQIYIGDSAILKSLNSDPLTNNKAGQIIYNGPQKMLKFFNGTDWINVTTTCPPAAPACGTAAKAYPASATSIPATETFCETGTKAPATITYSLPQSWTCLSAGFSKPCSATISAPAAIAACGPANNQAFVTPPPSNWLCATGSSPSAVTGQWAWTCINGTASVGCSAVKATETLGSCVISGFNYNIIQNVGQSGSEVSAQCAARCQAIYGSNLVSSRYDGTFPGGGSLCPGGYCCEGYATWASGGGPSGGNHYLCYCTHK